MADFSKLDAVLREFAEKSVPGCSCAVAQDGKILYEGYYGSADLERGLPVTSASLYRQASMTKLVTYTILMMLYEQGKVRMEQPISDFFPEWANKTKYVRAEDGSLREEPISRPITVRDATIMSCGLPYCFYPVGPDCTDPVLLAMNRAMEPLWAKGHYRVREAIRAIAAVPVAFDPGTHWLYGFGSELIGGVVEELTGMPLYMAMRRYIFEPLEMHDTDTLFRDDLESRLVRLYQITDDGFRPFPDSADRSQRPGEENEEGRPSIMTNVRDFSKFLQMWACGGVADGKRLLREETLAFMRTNCLSDEALMEYQTENSGYNAGYGYGYGVRTLMGRAAGEACGHTGSFGWTGGFGTWCEADPVSHVSITYMHNTAPNLEVYHHRKVRETAYACLGE
ncbi:MAG: beta-lactamase family protein [Clostridiaceae bacterium]|nr:beta-lactamase family protein [Clostridiaceae bacterium]MDD6273883.1 serine hydrolase [Clostridiaceae bacterium]